MPKRGGAKVSGCRSGLIAARPAACGARQVGVGLIVGIVVLFAASPGFAYRPFDGTDAAVADCQRRSKNASAGRSKNTSAMLAIRPPNWGLFLRH
jgi:hypothetical protein